MVSEPTSPPSAGKPFFDVGLEKANIRIRTDLELGAVEMQLSTAEGSARCVMAAPSAYRLAAALLMALGELPGPEGGR